MVRRASRQVTRRMMAATMRAAMGSAYSSAGRCSLARCKGGEQAEKDCGGGPDVGAEVDCIGLERIAALLDGDAMEGAGAGVVHGHGEQKDGEGPDGPAEVEMGVMHDAVDGGAGDPDAGAEHEDGLEGGGEALQLAVAVVVLLVGGHVRYADGEEGDGGGDEIDEGVRGLAEHAERAGEQAGEELEQRDAERREH